MRRMTAQNLISWRWSLPSPTDPVWWRSIRAISSYRGNRPTNIHTPTNTPTNGWTENGGPENGGPKKVKELKMQYWKWRTKRQGRCHTCRRNAADEHRCSADAFSLDDGSAIRVLHGACPSCSLRCLDADGRGTRTDSDARPGQYTSRNNWNWWRH